MLIQTMYHMWGRP